MKERIVELAQKLGFADCRVAPAQEARHAEVYRQWVEAECYGDMGWLARNVERRSDPRQVLAGAKAVLVLATNYHQNWQQEKGRGKIAHYAWGDDYHDIVLKRLKQLNHEMESLGGRQRYYVDTGPILERDFASEAGLGWTGKSTVQIHRRLGTWFFLSEILTTLDLEPDEPAADHCGKCTRCIDVCPTQAITRPHWFDARRCISYLTIEHKGSIPEEFRRPMGDRIFGCDDCLAICPWNRFARESQESQFAAREFVTQWDLRDYLGLDEEGFRQLFRRSPIKRTKRDRFLRNVCVALGNVGTRADLPALQRAAQQEDELVAEHARWAIREIQEREGGAQS